MARDPKISVIRWLRGMLCTDAKGETDKQLLDRFIRERDEDAFAVLLKRHGPMVLGICRRVLGNTHEAEDAFQATFLVLLHDISLARRPESVGGWLHEVAHRIAIKAVMAAAKQRKLDREKTDMPETNVLVGVDQKEMQFLLNEEIRRLPAKLRDPVVLCYLEGKTYQDAAQHLGVGTGTISKRLAQARDLLQKRLVRRGVTVSATATALASASQAGAAVPPALAAATLESAVATMGKGLIAGAVSAQAALMAKSMIQSMFWAKVKVAAATVLVMSAIGTGTGSLAYHAWTSRRDALSEESSPQQVEKPRKTDPEAAGGGIGEPAKVVGCTIDPPNTPLAARLLIGKESLALDLEGWTAADLHRMAEGEQQHRPLPSAPRVDLKLELRNTGKEAVSVWIVGDGEDKKTIRQEPGRNIQGLVFEFLGPQERLVWHTQLPDKVPQREILLAPQETCFIPIHQLVAYSIEDNKYFARKTTYWTQAGKYALLMKYHLAFSLAPKDGEDKTFRPITLTSAPIELEIK